MKSLVLLWSLVLFGQELCQDITFLEDEDVQHSRFSSNKFQTKTTTYATTTITKWQRISTERPKPVSDPERCPGNQLYYPGEPWFCDCGPKHIYYKPKNACYQAYMRGPCSEGQHLVVKNRNVQCVRNPCREGLVSFKGRCYELEKSNGPCEKIDETTAVLKINPDTLVIECTKTTIDGLTLFNFPDRCPPGSKRDTSNKCRENWNV